MEKYFVSNGSDIDGKNTHFHKCQEAGKPCIVVIHKTKYSVVDWDYISMSPNFDKKAINNENLLKNLQDIFQSVASDKSSYEMTSAHGTFYKVPKETAEKAASMIYDEFDKIVSL